MQLCAHTCMHTHNRDEATLQYTDILQHLLLQCNTIKISYIAIHCSVCCLNVITVKKTGPFLVPCTIHCISLLAIIRANTTVLVSQMVVGISDIYMDLLKDKELRTPEIVSCSLILTSPANYNFATTHDIDVNELLEELSPKKKPHLCLSLKKEKKETRTSRVLEDST